MRRFFAFLFLISTYPALAQINPPPLQPGVPQPDCPADYYQCGPGICCPS